MVDGSMWPARAGMVLWWDSIDGDREASERLDASDLPALPSCQGQVLSLPVYFVQSFRWGRLILKDVFILFRS